MEQYEAFLQEALRLTRESDVNPSVVYPFLERQQDKLNEDLIALIADFATRSNISDLFSFASLVQQFPHGRAINLEIAIVIYIKSLDFFSRQHNAINWATIHNNLGTAYSNRIRGKLADNIERAIHCYQTALEVRTRTAFPEDWATTQNNLGIAYMDRIRGVREDNIEEAIRCHEVALEVYTLTAFPEKWADTQNNLGIAYKQHIRGDRAQNLEDAISYYEAALEVYTRNRFPENWAMIQHNLGNVYLDRIRGERTQNLEKAIVFNKAALKVRTRTAFPDNWADTQNNLGTAYFCRVRGKRSDNLELAISCHEAALAVHTRENFPNKWAVNQNNLGNIYSNRMKGKAVDNLELAISCHEAALAVYTRENFPEKWAVTQNNLGIAYRKRIQGKRAENLEEAIRCFRAALGVHTRTNFPEKWAMTQENLAYAYIDLDNKTAAIEHIKASLDVFMPSTFPLNALKAGRNLGDLGYDRQNWETAIEGYDNAIRAVEQSRDWATNPQTKQQLIADALPLYGRMIEACFQLQRYEQALLTVERSKARTFTELLHNANRLPQNATPAQIQQYEQLNREIAALQYALDDQPPTDPTNPQPGHRTHTLPNPAPQTTPLLTLIQQRKTLLAEINDPTFNAFETVKPQLPDFAQLLTPTTAILQWFLPQDPDLGAYAFLITHQNSQTQIHPHHYSPAQRQALDQFNQTYNHDYRENSWYESLDQRLDHLAQLLDLPQLLTHRPNPCHHLILIPHLYLHLFPLHALTIPIPVQNVGAQCLRPPDWGASVAPLQDCFEKGVRYAPSCQILAYLQNRPRTQPTAPFFAIQNPTQDLHYADVEIDLIRRRFDPAHILKHAAANKPAFEQPTTRAQLHNSDIIHFACHGGFDSTNPLNSALILAGDKPAPLDGDRTLTLRDGRRFDTEHQGLTAAEIYRNLKLACRLVILSACETGRLDSRTTDEYIGLANALLYAGSGTVVDTLWCVDDFATAFLAVRFHEELTPSRTIAQAIQAATAWLRTRTVPQFLQWCEETFQFPPDDLDRCALRLNRYSRPHPFANRLYWAAFRTNGLE